MAIAPDASSGTFGNGSPTLTLAHTCTGSNLALVVGAASGNTSDLITGATATYNGVSMGSARVFDTATGNARMFMWVLAAPATGTHNIVITPGTSGALLCLIGGSFTGVDQTTPVDSAGTEHTSTAFPSSPFSQSVTVSAGGVAVDMFYHLASGSAFTPDATQTAVGSQQDDTGGRAGMSFKAAATAMSWAYTGASGLPTVLGVVALKAAAAGGTTVAGRKLLLGVGA